MAVFEKLIASMMQNPKDVRFADAAKVAEAYFGEPRIHGSHHKYTTPWQGAPMINLQQERDGKAKAYQVRQLLAAIERLEAENETL